MRLRRPLRLLLALLLVLVGGGAAALGAGGGWNGQTPPDDPNYAVSQSQGCINAEQWYLYSTIPSCTPRATDAQGSAGMFVDQAWKRYTTGLPSVVVAYIEGGPNWRLDPSDTAELAPRAYLNTGELPYPETSTGRSCGRYDCNADGQVNVEDYANDPRVHKPYLDEGQITPEDLIVAFGDCRINRRTHLVEFCRPGHHYDNDGNGYANDISGWNFSRGNDDPATEDSAYNHSDQEAENAVAQTDNGILGAGICPHCTLLFVKAGDEALDRTDRTAQAIFYAVDAGASVIDATVGELGYSSLERAALQYAWRKGVVVVMASNDFDSADHQAGMYWPHVWPGNGIVANGTGTGSGALGTDRLTTTFRERSNLTSFGPHALFSVPSIGGSTSESTPNQAGVAALVASYGRIAATEHTIHGRLNAGEMEQVVRETASPIDDPHLGWPGTPGATFNTNYGYGRPDVLAAMEAIQAGRIPPVPDIESPQWYALYDPTQTRAVRIAVRIDARRTRGFSFRIQYALGPNPTEAQFRTFAAGFSAGLESQGSRTITVELPMRDIPRSFWTRPFTNTTDLSSTEQYDVTIRVQVTDARGNMGEDRRAIEVQHDPTLAPGYPLHLAQGAESQPELVDLDGSGRLDLVWADENGYVHALDPLTRRELPGWPAHTARLSLGRAAVLGRAYEPVIADVAIGDLAGDGLPDVIVTSQTGRVYAFDHRGRLLRGWPRAMGLDVRGFAVPPPDRAHTFSPSMGAFATPVLARLPGGHGLDVLQAAYDGKLYAWDRFGRAVPGWPVRVALPPGTLPGGCIPIYDLKAIATPTIAYLDGAGAIPDVVEKSQVWCSSNGDIGPAAINYVLAFYGDGNRHPGGALHLGWPVKMVSALGYYNSAQDWLTEGADPASAADLSGGGRDEVIQTAGWFGSPYVIDGNGSGTPIAAQGALSPGLLSGLAAAGQAIAGVVAPGVSKPTVPAPQGGPLPLGFATGGAFARVNGKLDWFSGGTDADALLALAQAGQAQRIVNYMRGYDPVAKTTLPGFPQFVMGLPFETAPAVADVAGNGQPDVINNEDTSNVVAYQPDGKLVTGWPKFTGGWTFWTPGVGDVFGDGHNDVAAITREGYLFLWRTPGRASVNEANAYHQNDWHDGRYGTDTRAPGVPRSIRIHRRHLCFTAPGAHAYTGTAATYDLRAFTRRPASEGFLSGRRLRAGTPGPVGTRQCIALPRRTRWVGVEALDAGGLRSFPRFARVR